ncbi:hypothetical protein CC2G_006417 [Coprinopsis cinerea AmutBmut pab1-1]|nr:hypothetical protein CC2G_006417 [Coprinopsis cinerea AmutBmut pab1-1]
MVASANEKIMLPLGNSRRTSCSKGFFDLLSREGKHQKAGSDDASPCVHSTSTVRLDAATAEPLSVSVLESVELWPPDHHRPAMRPASPSFLDAKGQPQEPM